MTLIAIKCNNQFLNIPTKFESTPPGLLVPHGLTGWHPFLYFFCWKKRLNMVMVEVGKTTTVYAHFVRLLGVE